MQLLTHVAVVHCETQKERLLQLALSSQFWLCVEHALTFAFDLQEMQLVVLPVHTPELHVWPLAQVLPHAPQFSASKLVSVQTSSQSV